MPTLVYCISPLCYANNVLTELKDYIQDLIESKKENKVVNYGAVATAYLVGAKERNEASLQAVITSQVARQSYIGDRYSVVSEIEAAG